MAVPTTDITCDGHAQGAGSVTPQQSVGICSSFKVGSLRSAMSRSMQIYAVYWLRPASTARDAGTTGAGGTIAPVAFFTHNFMGAVRVHKGGATGTQKL